MNKENSNPRRIQKIIYIKNKLQGRSVLGDKDVTQNIQLEAKKKEKEASKNLKQISNQDYVSNLLAVDDDFSADNSEDISAWDLSSTHNNIAFLQNQSILVKKQSNSQNIQGQKGCRTPSRAIRYRPTKNTINSRGQTSEGIRKQSLPPLSIESQPIVNYPFCTQLKIKKRESQLNNSTLKENDKKKGWVHYYNNDESLLRRMKRLESLINTRKVATKLTKGFNYCGKENICSTDVSTFQDSESVNKSFVPSKKQSQFIKQIQYLQIEDD